MPFFWVHPWQRHAMDPGGLLALLQFPYDATGCTLGRVPSFLQTVLDGRIIRLLVVGNALGALHAVCFLGLPHVGRGEAAGQSVCLALPPVHLRAFLSRSNGSVLLHSLWHVGIFQ